LGNEKGTNHGKLAAPWGKDLRRQNRDSDENTQMTQPTQETQEYCGLRTKKRATQSPFDGDWQAYTKSGAKNGNAGG